MEKPIVKKFYVIYRNSRQALGIKTLGRFVIKKPRGGGGGWGGD